MPIPVLRGASSSLSALSSSFSWSSWKSCYSSSVERARTKSHPTGRKATARRISLKTTMSSSGDEQQNRNEQQRQEQRNQYYYVYKLGLTGSIGSGKSTVAKMFKERLQVPVFDSDAAVHELYEETEAVTKIRAIFGEDVVDSETKSSIDRKRLGEKVVGVPEEMAKLEAIVHPLVEEKRRRFVEECVRLRRRKEEEEEEETSAEDAADKTDVLVFDVPLLFEKQLENTVDGILVVSCSSETQRERVMNRTVGARMSLEKFEKIWEMQMPDEEKRKRATWVVDTEKSLEETERDIERIVDEIRSSKRGRGR
jgi:dephospho-CoA kinase